MKVDVEGLVSVRPPCSEAERAAAAVAQAGLSKAGFPTLRRETSALTGPVLVGIVAAVLRGSAVVLAFTEGRALAIALGILAALVSVPGPPMVRSRVLSRIPGFHGRTPVIEASVRGTGPHLAPPLVVVARLDSHPASTSPLHPLGRVMATAAGLLTLAVVVAAGLGAPWTIAAVILAVDAVVSVAVLTGRELRPQRGSGGQTSGLEVLLELSERLSEEPAIRDVHLVAAGGGTVGAAGFRAFLSSEPELSRNAWVVAVDQLGPGELLAVPERSRIPPATAHPAAMRALAQAAIETGEAIDVSKPRAGSSEARVAVAAGLPAVTLTTSSDGGGPVVHRTAEIIHSLARTVL